jgi:hypothetical protein
MFAWKNLRSFGAAAALILTMAACGGDGGGTATPGADPNNGAPPVQATTEVLTGTAATGAAVAGATVTAVNAAGKTATAVTASNGSFSVTIEAGAPYLLKVTTAGGTVLYSFSNAAGTVNLTTLTTLALTEANARKPLADLFANWATTKVTLATVEEATKKVNANFKDVFTGKSVDWKTYDFFKTAFTANGSGIDGVMDGLNIQISCASTACSYSISQQPSGSIINFSGTIDVSGINLGGTPNTNPTNTPPANSIWSLQLSGTVNNVPINQTIGTVPLNTVPLSEAGANAVVQSYGGLSGSFNQQGANINFSFGSLTTSYEGCGACAVGSTIRMTAKGTVTVSGSVNGITIPPTTTNFDQVYLYTRTQ